MLEFTDRIEETTDRDVCDDAGRPEPLVRFVPVGDILDRCKNKTDRAFAEKSDTLSVLTAAKAAS